jgi:hypothetical protein
VIKDNVLLSSMLNGLVITSLLIIEDDTFFLYRTLPMPISAKDKRKNRLIEVVEEQIEIQQEDIYIQADINEGS